MRTIIFLITLITLFVTVPICKADIVQLKNGTTLEAETKESSEGIWINGILFAKNEVKHIEKKPCSKEYYQKPEKPWYQDIINFFGVKTKDQQKAEEIQNRLDKNHEIIKEMDKLYDDERLRASLNHARMMQEVKRESARQKAKERARVWKMKKDFGKTSRLNQIRRR